MKQEREDKDIVEEEFFLPENEAARIRNISEKIIIIGDINVKLSIDNYITNDSRNGKCIERF